MASIGVVVRVDILTKDANQVAFIDWDDMVCAFSSERANDAFAERILPRASWSADNFFDSKCFHLLLEGFAKNGITIAM